MSGTVLTFAASLLVALLCLPVATYQRNKLANAVENLIRADATSKEVHVNAPALKALASQSLEIAYGLPSAVLTIIAYTGLLALAPDTVAILVPLSVAVALALGWLASPERLSWYLVLHLRSNWGPVRFAVSIVTVVLLVANVVGLVLAVTSTGE